MEPRRRYRVRWASVFCPLPPGMRRLRTGRGWLQFLLPVSMVLPHAPVSTAAAFSIDRIDRSITLKSLIGRAQSIRSRRCENIDPHFMNDAKQLSYSKSSYNMSVGGDYVRRGFCNWLVPDTIMIGQYPCQTPETYGASQKECLLHLTNMVDDAGVTLFFCLQTEIPPQDDDLQWGDGDIYLEPYYRKEFPRPFKRYGPIAQSKSDRPLIFGHSPIEDLNIPSSDDALLLILSSLLEHLDSNPNNRIYIHCWGGRGRAGLVGSCLASLMYPEIAPAGILDWVQRGYDTRAGAKSMKDGLKRSPQTEQQRSFVRKFVRSVQDEAKS